MIYTFEIMGIQPLLNLFTHHADRSEDHQGAEYLWAQRCALDAFLDPLESLMAKRGWDLDRMVETVIEFWVNHPGSIDVWKDRLQDAGQNNVLVARVSSLGSLRQEFERLIYS